METRASYVLVGAFVATFILGLFVAVLWVAGGQYREEYTLYRTYFNGPVTGLGRGTVARYNGIEAGQVTELAFDKDDPRRVNVMLRIDPTLRLHVDSVASIESLGLTGAPYLEITGGTANSPFLEVEQGGDYPVIPSKPNTLQQLAQSGPELVANLNIAGERFSDLLSDANRKAFADTLGFLQNTTAHLDDHAKLLDQTLEGMRTATESLNRTLSNADRALSSVNQAVGSFQSAAESANVSIQKIGRLSDDVGKTVLDAGKFASDASKFVNDADKVVTGQSVAQFTQLLAETRTLVASITRLSNELERQPTKFLFGDQRQGYTPK